MNPKQIRIEAKFNVFTGRIQFIPIDTTKNLDTSKPFRITYNQAIRELEYVPNYTEEVI